MKDTIRYRTAGGNAVTWKKLPYDPQWPYRSGQYECGGCGEEKTGDHTDADKHAQNCRAL
ncbi:hypothetical protein B0I32_13816 [Nonomuraea fuscirosea]|uniref:Uncharacterized protein n=1 Tax=Nonomuraea fuscirosea TaxID=1291556 RepID=A0A2T0LZR8_9ACTN|nr:hypothetical protein [Nonomuraea fuscirosea]PRX49711.1 hypothetical protein B0I32_13816 [Nonomuraea fuscirosea]